MTTRPARRQVATGRHGRAPRRSSSWPPPSRSRGRGRTAAGSGRTGTRGRGRRSVAGSGHRAAGSGARRPRPDRCERSRSGRTTDVRSASAPRPSASVAASTFTSVSATSGSTSIAASTLSVSPHGCPRHPHDALDGECLPAVARGRAARDPDRIRVAAEDDDRDRLGARLARVAGRRGAADARCEGRMEVRTDRAEHAAVRVRREHVGVRQQRPAIAGSRRDRGRRRRTSRAASP